MSIDVYPPKGFLTNVIGGVTVERATAQSIPTPNIATPITWTTELIDNSNFFTLSAPTVLTVQQSGWYSVSGFVFWGGASGGNYSRIVLEIAGSGRAMQDGPPICATLSATVEWYIPAGSAIRLLVVHDGSSARDVLNANLSVTNFATTPMIFNAQPYEENQFTVTATGFSGTAPTCTVQYVRIGKQVTLLFDALSGTSNATTFTLTGLPATLVPARNCDGTIPRLDAGVYAGGMIRVGNSTTMTLFPTIGGGTWTASGTKGFAFMTVTYIL